MADIKQKICKFILSTDGPFSRTEYDIPVGNLMKDHSVDHHVFCPTVSSIDDVIVKIKEQIANKIKDFPVLLEELENLDLHFDGDFDIQIQVSDKLYLCDNNHEEEY